MQKDNQQDSFKYYGIVPQDCEIVSDERNILTIFFHPVSFEEYSRRQDEYTKKIEKLHGCPVEFEGLRTVEERRNQWKKQCSYAWVAQIIRENAFSFIVNIIDSKDEWVNSIYPLTEKADINWIAWEYEHWFDAAFKRAKETGKAGLKLRGLNAAYFALPHIGSLTERKYARQRMLMAE